MTIRGRSVVGGLNWFLVAWVWPGQEFSGRSREKLEARLGSKFSQELAQWYGAVALRQENVALERAGSRRKIGLEGSIQDRMRRGAGEDCINGHLACRDLRAFLEIVPQKGKETKRSRDSRKVTSNRSDHLHKMIRLSKIGKAPTLDQSPIT
jgi:hypothetical protein